MIRTMIASCLLACSGFVSAQMTGGNPEEVKQTAPAPLYRDPVYDGVADPVVVWNKEDRSWWMLYTQRRANVNAGNVAYCYGNDIGIASSREDVGLSWSTRPQYGERKEHFLGSGGGKLQWGISFVRILYRGGTNRLGRTCAHGSLYK